LNWFKSICHILTIGGVVLATCLLVYTIRSDQNVMQQTSGAAFAVAFVVIPYCFARAVEQLAGR
jgi:hypothetical protein